MFLDIRDLEASGVEFDREVALPALARGPAESIRVTRARMSGSARPESKGVDFRARLEATVRMPCSRCLEPVETRLAWGFRLVLVPAAIAGEEGETEMDPDEVLFYVVEGGRADLRAIAREQLYLNLTQKPVCKAACQGLCPTCGSNRNRIQCGCRSEEVDPRLAPLLDLKKRLGDS